MTTNRGIRPSTTHSRVALWLKSLLNAFLLAVICVEEPELRERFGEQYDAYCRQVPRWLPWSSHRHGS